MNGWIKIHRKFTEWEWYGDHNVMLLFLHLMLKANFKDKKWRGNVVERGQLITSHSNLAKETKLSVKQVRIALNKLKTTGEVTIKTTNRFTVITIENYALYQDAPEEEGEQEDTPEDNQEANKGQTKGKQRATTKERKESNNDKKVKEVNNNNENRYAPDDSLNNAIVEFVKMRKGMKKPMTDRGVELMMLKLNEISVDPKEQVEIINQSIMNGWLGVFPLKNNYTDNKTNNPFLDMLQKGDY